LRSKGERRGEGRGGEVGGGERRGIIYPPLLSL